MVAALYLVLTGSPWFIPICTVTTAALMWVAAFQAQASQARTTTLVVAIAITVIAIVEVVFTLA